MNTTTWFFVKLALRFCVLSTAFMLWATPTGPNVLHPTLTVMLGG